MRFGCGRTLTFILSIILSLGDVSLLNAFSITSITTTDTADNVYNENSRRIRSTLVCRWDSNERFQVNNDVISVSSRRRRTHQFSSVMLFGSSNSNEDNIIDVDVEENDTKETSGVVDSETTAETTSNQKGVVKTFVRQLANLSLMDYKWRSSVFKSNKADRHMEESVARMMGETATYVRPMDASEDTIGPLGQAERSAVSWLSDVIEEEGERAKKMVEGDGSVVRPMESGEGPLAKIEEKAVRFLKVISDAETERMMSGKIRPMSMTPSKRGPLGEAEAKIVSALEEIKTAETFRLQQSMSRGGEIVRPIDVPGPLGELELAVGVIVKAEQKRAEEAVTNNKILIRPKDASFLGPLGEAEKELVEAIENLKDEERVRLLNIKRTMEENRPMEKERNSVLGVSEAFTVGLLRAPKMFVSVIGRVQELIASEMISNEEQGQSDQNTLLDSKSNDNGDGK